MQYSGIYDDGWMTPVARVVLEGGPAADLVLRAQVLPVDDQRLDVRVNGDLAWSQLVAAGALDLRIAVAPSATERSVELRWAATTALSKDDRRQAAALLQSVNITSLPPPTALRIPDGLLRANAQHTGIYRDGWAQQEANVVLAAGPKTSLIVRGTVPPGLRDQHLEASVDGHTVFSGKLAPGQFDVRAPLHGSAEPRRVALRWRSAASLSDDDPRPTAAFLTLVGIATGNLPTQISRFPDDLANPDLICEGIFSDGWMEQQVQVLLSGGPAADLLIRAQAPPGLDGQRVEVTVDDRPAASIDATDGALDLRIPLPETRVARKVDLAWQLTKNLSEADPRAVAALLRYVGIVSGHAPDAVARFPSDLRDPNLVSSGIYDDGWTAQEASVVLTGGPEADLVVRATCPSSLGHQRLDVDVDGRSIGSQPAERGAVNLRATLRASVSNRRILLRWHEVGAVSAEDSRPVAALIDMIAVVPRLAPQDSGDRADIARRSPKV